ncbi:DUF6036 family nucleotidyltransferase [Brevifollis gellanilyticus]|uniref:DUF6036 domain-containing protein n=1 Tax=Brevifollis gellanilyticus TaxID=748831 RepID=A0A512M557_9BACT|nr:DUF6036 family nucleotidyltransferase [Brevifollis gellanilyticus]GEP41858.1 hypothetical protein BGE01nite_11490 [Brevifollis gellanilyticus]
MDLASLNSLLSEARKIIPETPLIIFGSTSAFATWPDLPETVDTYLQTRDTDLILDPWKEETAITLQKAIGRLSLYDQENGVYADIIKPDVFANFPADFRDPLVPLEGYPNVWALNPHDMAVSKLLVGRPKDLRLLSILFATGRLDEALVRKLLWSMDMEEKWIVKSHAFLDEVVKAAWDLGYTRRDVKDTWRKP